MSDGFVGLDPDLLRANASIADDVVASSGQIRQRLIELIAEGQLGAWSMIAIDELCEELTDLATLCRDKATAMELAALGVYIADPSTITMSRLEESLADGLGNDGMSAEVAVELLLLPSAGLLPPGWTAAEVAVLAINGTPPPSGWDRLVRFWQRTPPYDQEDMAAWARDAVNRVLLERDLAALMVKEHQGRLSDSEARQLAGVRAIKEELARFESTPDPLTRTRPPVQLYIYDPAAFGGDGRAAISLGDLDTATHVAWMVPGMSTTVAGMVGQRAVNVYRTARYASDDGESVAVVDWVGYDAPSGGLGDDLAGVLTRDMARDGAMRLAADVGVLLAARPQRPHVTVVGNSYGSTTAAIAADDYALAATDLVLTGSPGAGGAGDAKDLTTGRDHTWVGSASRDFVTLLGITGWTDPSAIAAVQLDGLGFEVELMGNDPSEDTFNAQRFHAEDVARGDHWNIEDHDRYYAPDTESLYNVAAIVVGEYDEVRLAEHRYDPLLSSMQDPEHDREPTTPSHVQP